MMHTVFDAPRPETRGIVLILHSDGQVLMPWNEPVLLRTFIKKDGANGPWSRSQEGLKKIKKPV